MGTYVPSDRVSLVDRALLTNYASALLCLSIDNTMHSAV